MTSQQHKQSPRQLQSQSHFDTVIIGGAVMGSAAAYFLTEHPDYDETVCVLEPDPTYEKASTPRSGGSFRQQFSTPLNVSVSQFGLDFVDDWFDRVQVDGEAPELGFRDTGYLFLIDQDRLAGYQASHEVQKACGADVRLLEPAELEAEFPYLSIDGLVSASLGAREGTLDPWAFMNGFRQRARANGANYLTGKATGIDKAVESLKEVQLASGEVLTCQRIINCAGPRANEVAAMVGLDLPVEPRIRSSFVFDCRTPIDQVFPLTIDTTGVHVRREGTQYLAGTVPVDDVAVDPSDLRVRSSEFEEIIWPSLANRIPQFDQISLTSSWAGHYAYNTLDHNMIVGATPVDEFYFCSGFSGHGLQQAAAVGRGLAELIVDGSFQSLDLSPLGYERVLRNEPVLEVNII